MGKVTKISDDDEKGTAKPNEVEREAAGKREADAVDLVESLGADEAFVNDPALHRAVSMLPVDEDATKKHKGGKGFGKLPEGEGDILEAAVRGSGKTKYAVVTTTKYRKFVKAL